MREIEFRAWDGESNQMLHGTEFEAWRVDCVDAIEFCYLNSLGDPVMVIPMQYTGLKDKNGKKIFEGDIVLIDYTEPLIGEVIYISDDYKQNPGFYLRREEGGFGQQVYHFSSQDNREVIGNIYESPELLATQEETA